MFIKFHNAIIDPSELVAAQATMNGLAVKVNGCDPIRFSCDKETAAGYIDELFQIVQELGLADQEQDGPEFELDEDEKEVLKRLFDDCFEYVARDKDGKLYAYPQRPNKTKAYYENNAGQLPYRLDDSLLSEIDFETGPVSIAYLLLDN